MAKFTFTEPGPPVRKSVQCEIGDSFQCPCGEVMELTGAWLAAHWFEQLFRECSGCKQKFEVEAGKVSLGNGKWNR